MKSLICECGCKNKCDVDHALYGLCCELEYPNELICVWCFDLKDNCQCDHRRDCRQVISNTWNGDCDCFLKYHNHFICRICECESNRPSRTCPMCSRKTMVMKHES